MKILIVDDEIIVRAKLRNIFEMKLKQYPLGDQFFLCAEASNGVQAWKLIEQIQPDIVISDMRMPDMDGLELCRKCHSVHPEIYFIALSNFDDFDYVKGTLLNGAVDYILKHMLDEQHLYDALKKAYESSRGKLEKKELPTGNLNLLKADFVVNLLAGFYTNVEQIKRLLLSLYIPLGTRWIVPVGMWVSDYKDSTLDEKALLSFSVINIITEIMEEQENGTMCHLEDGHYVLLFSYEGIKSEQKIKELLVSSLNRIRFCIEKFLGFTVYFLVGRLQESILQVSSEYKKLNEQYKKKFYLEKDIWISEMIGDEDRSIVNSFYDADRDKKLYLLMINMEREKAEKLVDDVFETLYAKKPSETMLKMVVVNLLTSVCKAASDRGIQMDAVYRESISDEEILEMNSFYKMQRAFKQQMDCIFTQMEDQNNKELSPYMQQAVSYIYRHYKENLSQSEVAEALGISSAYLSSLFKRDMKESFPVFLLNVRMKYARYLLEQGTISLQEIAKECGFSDYIYFLKSFKKKFGCTPKEYMKGNQGEKN